MKCRVESRSQPRTQSVSGMCTPVCRVCLASDVAMHSIQHMQLLGIYETLTSTKLNTEDGTPNTICYICYWQLQRCRRFSETACRSQGILNDLLRTGILQITYDTVKQNLRFKQAMPASQTLSVTPIQFWSLYDQTNDESSPLTDKDEYVVVKEETVTEDEWIPIENIQVDVGVSVIEQSMEGGRSETDSKAEYFHCDNCNKSFTAKRSLMAHIRNHSGVKTYACIKCNKTFIQKGTLTRHMRIHTGEKPYACSQCNKNFIQKTDMTKHMRVHTGEKPYTCSKCGKAFSAKGHWTIHMRIHTGEKPYSCNRCNKTFVQKSDMTKHMQIHTVEKPYACSRCGKTFSEKGYLSRHSMRVHTVIKPYACNRCNKSFVQKSDVTKHIRIHTGEKPYACSRCGKTFAERGHLTKHMRIHTGDKPYACNRCGKTFSEKGSLIRHIRSFLH